MSLPTDSIPVQTDPSVNNMVYVPTDIAVHPNTFIAMVAAHIGMTQIPGTTRTNPNVPLLGGGDVGRFIPVLDAFASLAVSNPDRQVVAIAAQLHDPASDIPTTLTVAENAALTPGIPDHLNTLVSILRKLTEDPPNRAKHEHALYMEAYLFSGRRIAKRYSKNLLWLQGFEEEFIHRNEEHVPKLRLVLSALLTLHEALVPVLPGLKKNSVWSGKNGGTKVNLTEFIDVKLWQTALDLMTNSMNEACFLIGKPDLCKGLMTSKNHKGETISAPLHRAISKLTSHHRHITNLVTYAISPEGEADLKTFQVVAKKANRYTPRIDLPTAELIRQVVYTCLTPTDAQKFDMECARMVASVEKEFNYIPTDKKVPPIDSTVHCECALIQSFFGDKPPSPWLLPYIGVSKLSCAACHAWIQAFNNTNTRRFETRGTHGRWYQGWSIPENCSPELREGVKKVVGEAYLAWYESGGTIRDNILSDSSQADGCLGPVLTVADKQLVADLGQKMGELRIEDRVLKAAAAAAGGKA